MSNNTHIQNILFVGVELLDNRIVQPIKVCIFNTFLGLNYFIIQEFNPDKKYFLYMSWVELLDNKIVQSALLNYFIIQKFKSSKLNFRWLNLWTTSIEYYHDLSSLSINIVSAPQSFALILTSPPFVTPSFIKSHAC